MRRATLVVGGAVAALGLQACATAKPVPYGPVGPKAPFGYQDRQNKEGGFTVLVRLPPYAPPAELRSFFDRRAGELCPVGVDRTIVFRLTRDDYFASAPAVYGSAGISQRIVGNGELEGYVYCKADAAPAPTQAAAK